MPRTTTVCWRYLGLGTRLLPDQFLLLISHYCWWSDSGARLFSYLPSTGITNNWVSSPDLSGSANLSKPHSKPSQELRGHLRECSRSLFPVEVLSIGVATAALMGMVRTVLVRVNLSVGITVFGSHSCTAVSSPGKCGSLYYISPETEFAFASALTYRQGRSKRSGRSGFGLTTFY